MSLNLFQKYLNLHLAVSRAEGAVLSTHVLIEVLHLFSDLFHLFVSTCCRAPVRGAEERKGKQWDIIGYCIHYNNNTQLDYGLHSKTST